MTIFWADKPVSYIQSLTFVRYCFTNTDNGLNWVRLGLHCTIANFDNVTNSTDLTNFVRFGALFLDLAALTSFCKVKMSYSKNVIHAEIGGGTPPSPPNFCRSPR